MKKEIFHKMTYGLYLLSTAHRGKYNGQIVNSAVQVSSNPLYIVFSLNKQNHSHTLLRKNKIFTLSILASDTPDSFIDTFAFNSGRKIDKFKGISYSFAANGTPFLTQYCLGYLSGRITREIGSFTHTVFKGRVNEKKMFSDKKPLIYKWKYRVQMDRFERVASNTKNKRR